MAAESKLEADLREYAKDVRVLYVKFSSPGARGVPDRILVGTRGRVCFVELKAPGGLLSAPQARWLRNLGERGVGTAVVRDLESGKRLLDSLVAEEDF